MDINRIELAIIEILKNGGHKEDYALIIPGGTRKQLAEVVGTIFGIDIVRYFYMNEGWVVMPANELGKAMWDDAN